MVQNDREIVGWFTTNGNHIPIYKNESKQDAFNRSVAMINENKKKADIERNQKEAERLNNPSKVKNIKILGDFDPKLSADITKVAQRMHDEFPEAEEISTIVVKDKSEMGTTVAQTNGSLHILEMREDIVDNYALTQTLCRDLCQAGYLAGDGTFVNSTLSHEFAHNLDHSLFRVALSHSPVKNDKPVEVTNAGWAYIYSKALGREVKVGDVLTDIPAVDFESKFFKLDGVLYNCDAMSEGKFSDLVVPIAINNILSNWKELGYAKQPTESQLVEQLSGYVDRWYSPSDSHYTSEIFAESYSNYKSYGVNGNPLAQEVMRLTNQAYSAITASEHNDYHDFYDRFFKARLEMLEKKKRGGL